MPRISPAPVTVITDPAELVRLKLAAIEQFKASLKRSARGNLWTEYEGQTVSVFSRNDSYAWSIATAGDCRFSKERFESEEDALDELVFELGVGE